MWYLTNAHDHQIPARTCTRRFVTSTRSICGLPHIHPSHHTHVRARVLQNISAAVYRCPSSTNITSSATYFMAKGESCSCNQNAEKQKSKETPRYACKRRIARTTQQKIKSGYWKKVVPYARDGMDSSSLRWRKYLAANPSPPFILCSIQCCATHIVIGSLLWGS